MLDHILAEAKRDQAEFGFAQLRLVIVLPALGEPQGDAARAVRFAAGPAARGADEEERRPRHVLAGGAVRPRPRSIPVVRHLFKQLYDIDLPETMDLASTTLDEFFEYLAASGCRPASRR